MVLCQRTGRYVLERFGIAGVEIASKQAALGSPKMRGPFEAAQRRLDGRGVKLFLSPLEPAREHQALSVHATVAADPLSMVSGLTVRWHSNGRSGEISKSSSAAIFLLAGE